MTRNRLTGKRIAVYVRSSPRKPKPSSADDQMGRCLKLVTERGGEVPKKNQFKDVAISGTATRHRGLDRLMAMVRARQLDLVVVEDIDRLSRDLGNALAIVKELASSKVELLCKDGLVK